MRPEGVAAAQRELRRAGRAHDRLVRAERFEEAEDAWADYLTHANRVFLKLRAACHGQLEWPWWKRIMDQRRDDPLLAYIHHARNSDTHKLEDTTQRVVFGDSRHDLLRPLPVVDKGITYAVPRTKFGQSISSVGRISSYSFAYLVELVGEAASRLR